MPHLEIVGNGALNLNGDGQSVPAWCKDDPLAKQYAPKSYKKTGFDTAHLSRYVGTDFIQWYGRRADGYFHAWGPVFKIVS